MESHIFNAITNIRNCKKRPSKEEIFNWIQKRERIGMEDFNGTFEALLSTGSIYNKNSKDSYYIQNITNDDISDDVESGNSSISGKNYEQIDDNDLVNMVKNVMLNEKLNEKENMENLRSELKHKNELIDKLLNTLVEKEKTCNSLIETMLLKNTNTGNICNVCSTKETSLHRNVNNNYSNSHIPMPEVNHHNHSQADIHNEDVYSWILSNERSSIYDSISDISSVEENDYETLNVSSYSYPDNTSRYKGYLQSINIESAINTNHNTQPNHSNSINNNYNNNGNNNHIWPENTCLIVGSSILNNLDENKMNKGKQLVKIRKFPGSTIQDMYSYITPLLRKQPKYIILHIGGNDAPLKSADEILVELLQLKSFITENLPECIIYLSQPTTRFDNMKAKYTIRDLNAKLDLLNINVIDNSNIDEEQLGKKGLHLNEWGTSRLAMNYLFLMRQF